MAQGTLNMGYWSLMQLFHLRNGIVNPMEGNGGSSIPPLPTNIDTGITVVTPADVDQLYAK